MKEQLERMENTITNHSNEMKDALIKLSGTVDELIKFQTIMGERENHRRESDRKAWELIESNTKRIEAIELDRAKEEQSRQFIKKQWPWMKAGLAFTGTVSVVSIGIVLKMLF